MDLVARLRLRCAWTAIERLQLSFPKIISAYMMQSEQNWRCDGGVIPSRPTSATVAFGSSVQTLHHGQPLDRMTHVGLQEAL
jgi:hypothetical protein